MRKTAWVTATAIMFAAAPVFAAPTAKRCIDAAETGQQLRSAGRLMAARRSFAMCTATACPTAVRRDCARWLEEVDATMPTVAVRLEDENGREVPDGKVILDDGTSLESSAGRAVPLDPGAHRFTWVRPEGKIEQDVVIREGEHNRPIVLRVATNATPGIGPDRPPTTQPSSSRSGLVPLIVGTLGVTAMGAGSVFWYVGLHDRSTLESTCKDSHSCAQSDIDASHTKLVVGDIFMGVGIIALAGAFYLYFSQASDPPATTAQR